jgi:uncharacterized tellurite resistance protein B-like protein
MNNLELFHNLVNLAAADRKFTEEEIKFLIDRANHWGIPDDEFETAMAGISAGELQMKIPESHEDRVIMMKEMLRLMAADGELADMEKAFCAQASGKMDFTSRQFNEILDEVIGEAN